MLRTEYERSEPRQTHDSDRDVFVRVLDAYSVHLRQEPTSIDDALFCSLAASHAHDDPTWLDSALLSDTKISILIEAIEFGVRAINAEIAEIERCQADDYGLSSALLNDILELSLMVEPLKGRELPWRETVLVDLFAESDVTDGRLVFGDSFPNPTFFS